jgi:hydroxylaminobenzene mutase
MDLKRRLIWHGIFLFLLGLLTGAVVSWFTNPRLGLSAHLAGVGSGAFLLALGAAWNEVKLAPRAATAAFWLALYGSYGGWMSLLLGAAFGTSRSTPIAGAGHVGAPWQEEIVDIGLVTMSAAIIVACAFILRGLGARAER